MAQSDEMGTLKESDKDDLIQRLQKEVAELKSQLDKYDCLMRQGNIGNQGPNTASLARNSQGTLREQQKVNTRGMRNRAQGISGEPQKDDIQNCTNNEHFPKDEKDREQIKKAILANNFMKNYELSQINEIVECMSSVKFKLDDIIIKEGDDGEIVYVMAEGKGEVSRDSKVMISITPGTVFGELAMLYNCKRTATIKGREETN